MKSRLFSVVLILLASVTAQAASGLKDFSVGEILVPGTGSHEIYSIAGEYRLDGFQPGVLSMSWKLTTEPSSKYRDYAGDFVMGTGGVWTTAPYLPVYGPTSSLPAAGTQIHVRWELFDSGGNSVGAWTKVYTILY